MPKAITCRSYGSYFTYLLQKYYFFIKKINYLSNLILLSEIKKYKVFKKWNYRFVHRSIIFLSLSNNFSIFTLIYTIIGFGLAAYSVIANDSVQTLGTFIASNQRFKWYWLATAGSAVLAFTLIYGWTINDGDITFGRLNKIPYQTIQWYHACAPLILVLLTRGGIPVSTTFLVLSAFASTVVLEKVLMKSVIGYGLAAMIAYMVWIGISYFINEKFDKVQDKHRRPWVIAQWCTTGSSIRIISGLTAIALAIHNLCC